MSCWTDYKLGRLHVHSDDMIISFVCKIVLGPMSCPGPQLTSSRVTDAAAGQTLRSQPDLSHCTYKSNGRKDAVIQDAKSLATYPCENVVRFLVQISTVCACHQETKHPSRNAHPKQQTFWQENKTLHSPQNNFTKQIYI